MMVKALNNQIYTEAADWLLEFRSGDIDDVGRKEFYHWLRTSPEHMRAYLELAAIWNEGSTLDSQGIYDEARLAAGLQAQTNVTPFQVKAQASRNREDQASVGSRPSDGEVLSESDSLAPQPMSPRGSSMRSSSASVWRGHPKAIALAASVILMLGGAIWYDYAHDIYATNVGEDRVVTLSDGSTIDLNSDSRVRIRFSKDTRGVQLLQGQALFHVAKDHSRPFVVRTNNTQIRAVGTQFDVYKNRTGTTVTVVEGTVAVLQAAGDSSSVNGETKMASNSGEVAATTLMLSAGDQVTVAPAMQPKSIKADVASVTAWTQHELVFKGTPLQDVAFEFNRYNERHLIIRDSAIANLKVTGIFSSADPSSLLRFLKARPDIEVTEASSEIIISQKP